MMQFRKVYVSLVKEIGLEGAYILDALVNARNFQNTEQVVFTKPDAESIGINRYQFDKAIKALESSGYIARIPNSKPMRFIIQDKADQIESTPRGQTVSAEIDKTISRNRPTYQPKSTDLSAEIDRYYYKEKKENNRELVSSFSNTRIIDKPIDQETDKTNELEKLVSDYFQNKGVKDISDQVETFFSLKYNKGKYAVTIDNYQWKADKFIEKINRKPQKKSDRSDYKTFKDYAIIQGVTVEELLADPIEKETPERSEQSDGIDESLISLVFGDDLGVNDTDNNQEIYISTPLLKAV